MAFFLRLILLISFLAYLVAFSWGLHASEDEYRQIFIKMLTSAAGLSIIVAFFALWLTLENFLRKTNLDISGKVEFDNYQINKSGYSYDKSVVSFQLNNYKDKTVVIYKVYLRLKANLYIELLDTSREPILLKAYDTYYKKLEKPLFYLMNHEPKLINSLDVSKVKLFLDTNEGKYKVKKPINAWVLDHDKILYPVIPSEKYDFNYRFIIIDSVTGFNKKLYVEYDQENIEIWGRNFDLSEIKDAEELKNKLKHTYGVISSL